MIWYSGLGIIELVFIAIFILFYLFFLFRMIKLGKAFRTPIYAIYYKLFLRSIIFLLLIVSLMGPSFGDVEQEVKSIGKDILIAVDLSSSMNANDIQPTRLEKVKFELKKLVDSFNADRIGIIMFSNEAFMACPLTYDQSALNLFIETLNTGLVPNTGTDFGPPLEMCLEKLQSDESKVSRQSSKVIILISDGEDFGKETDEIAKKIHESGIKLFTLGIGTEKGSRIPTPYGAKTDRNGQEVISKLNNKDLKRLAVNTGGKYFEINEKTNEVSRMISSVDRIEGELRDVQKIDVSANKYYYFLALALLLLAVDVLWKTKTIKI